MGMEIRDKLVSTPDIFGLPIYRPTKFIKERVGDEVRLLCGVEAFGQISWTHVTILKPEDMQCIAQDCGKSTQETTLENFDFDFAVGH